MADHGHDSDDGRGDASSESDSDSSSADSEAAAVERSGEEEAEEAERDNDKDEGGAAAGLAGDREGLMNQDSPPRETTPEEQTETEPEGQHGSSVSHVSFHPVVRERELVTEGRSMDSGESLESLRFAERRLRRSQRGAAHLLRAATAKGQRRPDGGMDPVDLEDNRERPRKIQRTE